LHHCLQVRGARGWRTEEDIGRVYVDPPERRILAGAPEIIIEIIARANEKGDWRRTEGVAIAGP
jgi:alkylation response protein AidB-like acyl-CoA dehydrogenase